MLARNQNSTKQTYSRIKPLIGVFGLDTGTPRTPEFGAPLCRDHQERAGSHRVRGSKSDKTISHALGEVLGRAGMGKLPGRNGHRLACEYTCHKRTHVGIYFATTCLHLFCNEAEFELECLRVTPTPMDGRPYLHHELLLACSRLLPSSLLQCSTTLPSYLNPRTKRTRIGSL